MTEFVIVPREPIERVIRRLQADIDGGSRPDQWSMEDMVRLLKGAIAAAPAVAAEPVNQQLLEALRPIAERGEISAKIIAKARAAIAAAEAQPALPTQEQIMRLADAYAARWIVTGAALQDHAPEMYDRKIDQRDEARAALQAALAALPKGQP